MHTETILVGIALVILGYGYFSKLLNRWNISGPMAFTATGIMLSPLIFGKAMVHFDNGGVQLVAQIALILVLFVDASGLSLKAMRGTWKLPARLLFVAMPITIVAAFFTVKAFCPDAPESYLLLTALVLAPTDAALGKPVVTDPRVPAYIRNAVNVESGLNDGIVFPLLLTVLLAIGGENSGGSGWVPFVAQQIVLGALAGAAVGLVGGLLGNLADRKGWMGREYGNLVPVALAVFAFYAAETVGGNGYIAAFFGGLVLGNVSERLREDIENFTESEGDLLVMLSFLVFGLVLVPLSVPYWDFKAFAFALLSLTVLRMVPVAVALGKTGLDWPSKLFIGWFGPRGIASVLYILIAAESIGDISNHAYLFALMTLTVLLSIVLHGFTANPLVARFGASHARNKPFLTEQKV